VQIASLRAGYQLGRANPIDFAARITAPALLIHGDQDPFVTPAEIETVVARIAGPRELWRVPDAGHREAWARHDEEYNRRIVAWFERHLPPD
jgi:dipeptidyl aminopeptidase/acylaminoacyl peptidase